MRRLHLIKHGAPRIDPALPSHAWSLSEVGRAQAQHAADALRAADLAVVVSSEEPKARETAEVLAAALGLPSQVMLGLHEQLRYSAPHVDSHDAFRARVQAVLARPGERSFGDETGDAAHARFRTAVEAVMRVHAGNVAIVAHGTVMALLVARARGDDPVALWCSLSDLSVLTLPWPEASTKRGVRGSSWRTPPPNRGRPREKSPVVPPKECARRRDGAGIAPRVGTRRLAKLG